MQGIVHSSTGQSTGPMYLFVSITNVLELVLIITFLWWKVLHILLLPVSWSVTMLRVFLASRKSTVVPLIAYLPLKSVKRKKLNQALCVETAASSEVAFGCSIHRH